MSNKQIISLGSAFPVSGKGVALLLWLIVVLWYGEYGGRTFLNPIMYVFFLLGSYIMFSRKYLQIIDVHKGTFRFRIGLGKMSYGKTRSLSEYKYGLLQKGNWTTTIKQGAGHVSVTEGKYKERYTGLFLVTRKDYIKVLFCKKDLGTIKKLIIEFIQPYGLPLYNGARKAGNEITFKA